MFFKAKSCEALMPTPSLLHRTWKAGPQALHIQVQQNWKHCLEDYCNISADVFRMLDSNAW